MPVLPGNYGTGENLKRRDSDSNKIKFDFTVNIPTIITVLILAGTLVGWLRGKYETLDVFIAQHNAMWSQFLVDHPDASNYVRKQ